jgi:hypothetical protein
MTNPVSDLAELLRSLEPVLNEGVWVYSAVPHGTDLGPLSPIATVREAEALTVIVSEEAALAAGLPVLLRAAWITLEVHSDLHAVGLTAAFSGALGRAGISCNVVAGARHDHLFVPVTLAHEAVRVLQQLQQQAMS